MNDQPPGRTRPSWGDRLSMGRGDEQATGPDRRVDAAWHLYIDLCILEERIQGNWPAVEGIRIVRERKDAHKGKRE